MSNCILIGSAPFDASTFQRPQPGDFVVCADGGYDHLQNLGIVPNLVVGDFDSTSLSGKTYPCEVIRLQPEKDDTDMLSAVKIALSRGWTRFRIYGGLGGRLDHTIANIQTLSYLLDHGASGILQDGKTWVTMLDRGTLVLPKADGCYLSVFAYSEACPDVTLKGVKYPLNNANVTASFPIGVSNEIIGDRAEIITQGGRLLVLLAPKSPQ